MRLPKMDLPPASMPWGRGIQDEAIRVQKAIEAQQLDASSVGSQFRGRAENLETQIRSIPSVAAIYSTVVPPFSVSRFSTGAVRYVYPSGVNTFNPPRPDRPYTYSVIANMKATGIFFPFSRSLLRINGVTTQVSHESLQTAYLENATFSILGTGSIGPGEAVSVEFGIDASSIGTVTFQPTTLWCVFSGSIN
jgi:hypothetical protein